VKKPPRRRERCILGIDVGGTNIRAGLFSPRLGRVGRVLSTPTQASWGGSHSLARVVDLARQAVEEGRTAGCSVSRVGIGIPELIGARGEIQSHCALPWRATQVRTRLAQFGPVTLTSDVRAAALAEARVGAGRDIQNFLYITVGTGVACTLVIDGKPYGGAHGHAISFASGPTVAVKAGGNTRYQALEARVSGPALVRVARTRGLKLPDAAAVCRLALKGPGIAREVVDAAATELAVHVAILANALDPALILLGGGLGSAPGRYWTTFRSALPRFTWGTYARRIRVRRAQLGGRVGVVGAALSALEAHGE